MTHHTVYFIMILKLVGFEDLVVETYLLLSAERLHVIILSMCGEQIWLVLLYRALMIVFNDVQCILEGGICQQLYRCVYVGAVPFHTFLHP